MPSSRNKSSKRSSTRARKGGRKSAKKTAKNQATGEARPSKANTKKTTTRKSKKTVKKATARKKVTSRTQGRRTPAARRSNGKSAPATSGQSIHCTLALTGKWSMVLPTSVIAEITDYQPPAPLDNSPDWLLGQVEWEDWQVPVISYGALIDAEAPETATGQSRIMVVKSLSSTARVPFIGVMVKEIPKLAKITESDLQFSGDEGKSLSVHSKVKLGGQPAVIPDLDRLSQLVSHAAYGTINKEGPVGEA